MRLIGRVRDACQTLHSDEGGQALAVILSCVHTAFMSGVTSIGAYLFDVAQYVQQQGARAISIEWYNKYHGKDAPVNGPAPVKRNYNQPEKYHAVKLPEHLLPHVWAAAHDNSRASA